MTRFNLRNNNNIDDNVDNVDINKYFMYLPFLTKQFQ